MQPRSVLRRYTFHSGHAISVVELGEGFVAGLARIANKAVMYYNLPVQCNTRVVACLVPPITSGTGAEASSVFAFRSGNRRDTDSLPLAARPPPSLVPYSARIDLLPQIQTHTQ